MCQRTNAVLAPSLTLHRPPAKYNHWSIQLEISRSHGLRCGQDELSCDWGKQFGLLTVEGQRFGSEAELVKEALKHLLEVYARLNALFAPEEATSSILRKVGVTVDDLQQHIAQNPSALEVDADNDHYINLLRLVARYPDVTAMALRNHEPSTTLTYLFRLTHHVSASYDVIRVVGSDISRDVTLTRAALYASARQVLTDGMRLLGIVPVDRYVMN